MIRLHSLFLVISISLVARSSAGESWDDQNERLAITELETSGNGFLFHSNRQRTARENSLPPNEELPVNVTVELAVEGIRDIGVDAMIDFYASFRWFDIRERHERLFLSGAGSDRFSWTPDIYFLLSRKLEYFERTQYLQIENGTMVYDEKVSVSVPCVPHPFWYPFDHVKCLIRLSSYGYDSSMIRLTWSTAGVHLPENYFKLEYIGFAPMNENSVSMNQELVRYGSVYFWVLSADLLFERLYGAYVFQLFLPAAVLVVVSWATFWINRGATPARATVGITTILTMLTLTTSRKEDRSKYLSMTTSVLDLYLWVCFIYVILAFVLFAVSDFTLVRDKNIKLRGARKIPHQWFDTSCRAVFPLTFLVFNGCFVTCVLLRPHS